MRLRAATQALFIAHWWLFRWTPRVRKSSFVGTYPLSCSRPPEIPSWLMYETFLRIGSPRTSHSTLLMKLYTGKTTRNRVPLHLLHAFFKNFLLLRLLLVAYWSTFRSHFTRLFWSRSNNSPGINVQLYFSSRDSRSPFYCDWISINVWNLKWDRDMFGTPNREKAFLRFKEMFLCCTVKEKFL